MNWHDSIRCFIPPNTKAVPIVDAEVIGYTKAVSEGFTAERNNKLVAIAPQRMKNNGYYN